VRPKSGPCHPGRFPLIWERRNLRQRSSGATPTAGLHALTFTGPGRDGPYPIFMTSTGHRLWEALGVQTPTRDECGHIGSSGGAVGDSPPRMPPMDVKITLHR